MEIIPAKLVYKACVQEHDLKVIVQYFKIHKSFEFYFENKMVSSKVVRNEDHSLYQKDDVIIEQMIKEYCKNNSGPLSDIFSKYSKKVRLKSKEVAVTVQDGYLELYANFLVQKDLYTVNVWTVDKSVNFSCQMKANSFSEVLESLRLFSGVLGSANVKLSEYVDSFSRDEIKDKFEWYVE